MYVYMYLLERWYCRVTLWLYVFGEKLICHDTLTFIHFVSASVWKCHDIFMYSIYGI